MKTKWVWVSIFLCQCFGWNGAVTGKIEVLSARGRSINLAKNPVVLYLEDKSANIPKHLVHQTYHMDTKDKQFLPRIIVIPVGGTVTFTNFDPILHNVFSVSGKNRFDGGLFKKGETAKRQFEHPGLVRVFCNVHHSMNALIYISPNPYYTVADEDGNFQLSNIPSGTYSLAALHQAAGTLKRTIEIKNGKALQLQLELQAPSRRSKRHLDKDGKPYKRRRSNRY